MLSATTQSIKKKPSVCTAPNSTEYTGTTAIQIQLTAITTKNN